MSFKPHFSWEFLEFKDIQTNTLRAFINNLSFLRKSSDYYNSILSEELINSIKTFDDIKNLPITNPQDLYENYSKFLVSNETDIRETILISNGRKVLPFSLTFSDLDRVAYNESLSYHGAGVSSADRVQIFLDANNHSYAYTSIYRGLIALGANILRTGVKKPKEYLELIVNLEPTVIISDIKELLNILKYAHSNNITLTDSSIKQIHIINSSIYNYDNTPIESVKELEQLFNCKIFFNLTIPETSVTFSECSYKAGAHSHPELAYIEILDENNQPLPDGELGELTITPFGIESLPVLRYKTGIRTYRVSDKCQCGRNSVRLGPISRIEEPLPKPKSENITIFRGNELNLDEIVEYLKSDPYIKAFLIELSGTVGVSEDIFIHAATTPSMIADIMGKLREISNINIPVVVSNSPTINRTIYEKGLSTPINDARKGLNK